MTNVGTSGSIPTGSIEDGQSKPAQVANVTTSAASEVASTAAAGAKDVASEAASQVKVVAGEAKRQVDTAVDKTRQELSAQAEQRTQQAAGGLRRLADQVTALAEGRPDEAGSLIGYLGDAHARVSSMADRLESGGPQGLFNDVTDFARRRPVVFLAAAVGAGFMVGRLARAGKTAQDAEEPTPEFASYARPSAAYIPRSAELPPRAVIADAPVLLDEPLVSDVATPPYTTVPGQP